MSDENYTSTSGVASLDNLPDSEQYGAFPSQEDSAIGVDIDSLPVLINDLALNTPSPTEQPNATDVDPSQAAPNPDEQQTPTVTSTLRPSTTAETPSTANRRNPFAATPQNTQLFDLNLPGIGRSNNSSPVANSSLNSGFAPGFDLLGNSTQSAQSPLRSAIQQYNSRANNGANSSPLERSLNTTNAQSTRQNNPLSQTASNQSALDGRLQPGQPVPSRLLPSTSLQTSPPIGTTGYTLPPVLRTTPSSAPSNAYNNTGQTQTLPGLPSAPQLVPPALPQTGSGRSTMQTPSYGINQGNLVNPYNLPSSTNPRQAQPQYEAPDPEPAPFTAPYSRGGGEINTFANP